MADTKISYVRVEPVKNGYILSYDVKTKRPGSNDYDSYDYSSKKEIFQRKAADQMLKRIDELMEMCSDSTEITFAEGDDDE